jgi:L-alanine-DL-glutamate epimerase-like enolase superfamily enzyme
VKIERIEAIPYSIPYAKPLEFASGRVSDAEHVLIRVHTDDGVVGTADAPPQRIHRGSRSLAFAPGWASTS